MQEQKRPFPPFLSGIVEPADYERWLKRKAAAHVKRDSDRGFKDITGENVTAESYRKAIHAAVLASDGRDAYTGRCLNWSLISKYDNDEAKKGGHQYKADFAHLPTVDHAGAAAKVAAFQICGWRTNDAKNDLSLDCFIMLSEQVLSHAGYSVTKNQ